MGKQTPPQIDRLFEADNNVIEFFIEQNKDWESDPLLVKNLRSKIKTYKEYINSDSCQTTYPNHTFTIILETKQLPPEEIHRLLSKEGLEIRVGVSKSTQKTSKSTQKPKHKIDRIEKQNDGVIALFAIQNQDWESDPFLVKNLRDKIKAYKKYLKGNSFQKRFPDATGKIILETNQLPPKEIHELLTNEGLEIRVLSKENTKHKTVEKHSKNSTPVDVVSQETQTPARQEEDWEKEDYIDNEPFETITSSSSGNVMIFGVLLGLSILGVLYGLFGMMNPPKAPSTPQLLQASQVSATTTQANYVTIQLTPKWYSFIPIPIQEKASTKRKLFVAFAAKETPKILIFASREQSQIIRDVKTITPDPSLPENTKLKVIWTKDLKSKTVRQRTYTGALVKAQLRKNGPLELVLPDGHRDLNKIYAPMRLEFPRDTMILLVGQKPKPLSSSHTIIFLIALLSSVIFGGLFFSSRKKVF